MIRETQAPATYAPERDAGGLRWICTDDGAGPRWFAHRGASRFRARELGPGSWIVSFEDDAGGWSLITTGRSFYDVAEQLRRWSP